MSIKLMSKVFEMDIPTGQKFVLLALADRAGDDGKSCFPSQKEIARKTSLSVRSVQRYMTWLEENGLIKRTERRRADGYRSTDEYILTLGDTVSGDNLTLESQDTEINNKISSDTQSRDSQSGDKYDISQATGCQGNKLPTVINNTSVEPSDRKNTKKNLEKEFDEEFWPLAVKRKSVGSARKSYIVARSKAEKDQIIKPWRTHNLQWKELRGTDDWQYVPYPATWLSQERWGDEIERQPLEIDTTDWPPWKHAFAEQIGEKAVFSWFRDCRYAEGVLTVPSKIFEDRIRLEFSERLQTLGLKQIKTGMVK